MRAGRGRVGGTAAGLLAAALALFGPGAARADAWGRRDRERSPVGLHLELGGLFSDAGAGGAADLGLRLGPFLATGAYRAVDAGGRGRVSWTGGRLQYLLLDADWVSVHAGLGAGALRREGSGASAGGVALTAGAGVSFLERGGFNLLGLGVELWLPVAQGRFDAPAGAPAPRVPVVMAMVLLNPLYLYALK